MADTAHKHVIVNSLQVYDEMQIPISCTKVWRSQDKGYDTSFTDWHLILALDIQRTVNCMDIVNVALMDGLWKQGPHFL